MEILRDPSHLWVLALEDLEEIVWESALSVCEKDSFDLQTELVSRWATSLPRRGEFEKVRRNRLHGSSVNRGKKQARVRDRSGGKCDGITTH